MPMTEQTDAVAALAKTRWHDALGRTWLTVAAAGLGWMALDAWLLRDAAATWPFALGWMLAQLHVAVWWWVVPVFARRWPAGAAVALVFPMKTLAFLLLAAFVGMQLDTGWLSYGAGLSLSPLILFLAAVYASRLAPRS